MDSVHPIKLGPPLGVFKKYYSFVLRYPNNVEVGISNQRIIVSMCIRITFAYLRTLFSSIDL